MRHTAPLGNHGHYKLHHHLHPYHTRLQVTVFPAFLALDARRELRKRLALGGCCGCLPPGSCVRDPAQEAYELGANGWSLETNIYKVRKRQQNGR